ncbi:hypothetical protein E1B06_21110 [Brevibacillus laterosporus]|uniref:hypothetical protein n=1 Tax=Brevibacillus laterosporus TaxID=1465 RepID=UPI002404B3CC|nr:hypothetical protein [Brevibacillus laterosporus]MDF9414146.1 hypothetical protein [Brevibacillus laterosporus]
MFSKKFLNSVLALTVPVLMLSAPASYVHAEKNNISTEQSDKNNIHVETVTIGNEEHTLIIDTTANTATLDGKEVKITPFFDETLRNDDKAQGVSAKGIYDPVYYMSFKVDLDEQVTTIGEIATVIGGGITIGAKVLSKLAIKISHEKILSKVADWATYVGLGTLAVGKSMDGYIQFNQYRTNGKVQTGMGGKELYQYRFQDTSVYFKLFNFKPFDHQFNDVGDWFYAEKPYFNVASKDE